MPLIFKPKAEAYDVLPPKIAPNSFLGDFISSDVPEKEDQMTAGFYKVIPGEPLVYTYTYDEFKIVLEVEGKFIVTDEEGTTVYPKPGDFLYFKKGATITFTVEGDENAYSYNYYVGKKHFGQI
ncbi:hypothetical protein WICANDRAFT_76915 [Wickerhamomyces anomalus NRRL Y-366-8]|uniref:(S)-ureidoglycine aminohydrolase cupin domain-containing protein n=1 Tax=Wickerhamomyces anomalus (strain ATCC 58044 / CBS 1984 / NCYC 433 / NRRL Y-366-8) TaxID=683960 RepID=A0A1E3PCR2_WICAA|nr:uncharacterized protein WICANDRAFT_76915 [Wickerhamomyces anomalus NRRL Y-366-8]ODQ62752.1 hypothetical protein WICANDRAFT_76915 [Wickerhamomyces anomalus NRRL Y-366-8]